MNDNISPNNDEDEYDDDVTDISNWIEKAISHPCETALNIESNTTIITVPPPRETEMVDSVLYDDKDKEIERSFQDIYDASMDTFDYLQSQLSQIEGQYKSRHSEVSAMFLNSALAAATAKLKQKDSKDKLKNAPNNRTMLGDTSITNNTQINVTTAELVKMKATHRSPINNTVDVPITYNKPDTNNITEEIEEVESTPPVITRTKIPRVKIKSDGVDNG